MAIPRHRTWYLEDFIKRNIHPDASVLVVGDSFQIPLRNICRQKGLQLRKRAGTPKITECPVGECDLEYDLVSKSQDLVLFLNCNPSLDELREAARISRMYVVVQRRGSQDVLPLHDLGYPLVVTFLPAIAADDRSPDWVLYVLDVSQAAKESEQVQGTERTRLEEIFGVAVKQTGPGQFLGVTLPQTRTDGSGAVDPQQKVTTVDPPQGPSVHNSEAPPADPVMELAERAVSLEEQLLGRAVRPSFPSKAGVYLCTDFDIRKASRTRFSGGYRWVTRFVSIKGPILGNMIVLDLDDSDAEMLAAAPREFFELEVRPVTDDSFLTSWKKVEKSDDIKTIGELLSGFPPPDPRDVYFAGDAGPSGEQGPAAATDLRDTGPSGEQRPVITNLASGTFPGSLQEFTDRVTASLTDREREVLAERFSLPTTGRTQTAAPNPSNEELASSFGSLMDGLSQSELDLLTKRTGISIPPRNGLDESLEDYGNRVRALVELSIQEGVETTSQLSEQDKLASATLEQKFRQFWDLTVSDPFPLRDPAHRLPVKDSEIGNYEEAKASDRVFEIDFDDEPITEEEKVRGFSESGWYFFEAMDGPKVQGPFPSRDVAEQQCLEFQNTLDQIATLLGDTFSAIHYARSEKFLGGPGYTTSGWYFTDETSSHVFGPYETKVTAARALFEYCESLEPKES